MSRSVMDRPRNAFQQLTDLLFGRTYPEQATNAFTSLSPLRIGVLPGRERIASDIIKRGLKEPWFHGSRAIPGILDEGALRPGRFDPSRIGSAYGLRLGEPAGVSLSRSPEAARTFGDVLRVGVDIPPSSVGQFVDPEFQRLLRASFEAAHQSPGLASWGSTKPLSYFLEGATGGARGDVTAQFNQAMSNYLRQKGVEGIAYSPRRWAEYELRVLDPSKAVPLGRVPTPTMRGTIHDLPGGSVMERYLYGSGQPEMSVYGSPGTWVRGGLSKKLAKEYVNAPTFPVRLRDVLGIAAD